MKRKKQKKILIAISTLIILLTPTLMLTQAATTHNFEAVEMSSTGMVKLICTDCSLNRVAKFGSYINVEKNFDEKSIALDVVNDGIINAKDYAKLNNEYSTTTTTSTTTKPSTTNSQRETTTDKDGYGDIIKP